MKGFAVKVLFSEASASPPDVRRCKTQEIPPTAETVSELNLSFSPTFRLGFRAALVRNHFNGFKTQLGKPMALFCVSSGARRETIKMVTVSFVR